MSLKNITSRAGIIAAAAIAFSFAGIAHAQFNVGAGALGGLTGVENSVGISMSPQNPGPDNSVTLTAASSLIDLSNSVIAWRVNGKVVSQQTGVTDFSLVTKGLGVETDVEADVSAPDGTQASAEISIIPTEVDLLMDSDSYIPPFYHGRALPSAGTNLHLEAIAYFKKSNGASVAASDIIYTWKQNGVVLGSLSGRGKSAIVAPAPMLYGTDTIEVDAASADHAFSGSASVTVPSIEPLVTLYEDHPLFGIEYSQALGSQASVRENEMTFAAVPYFAQVRSPNDPRLIYAWTVNGSTIATSAQDPSEITINANNSDGNANLGLSLNHSTNFYMQSGGSWAIAFGSSGSGGGGAINNDPFHGQGQ